MTDIFQWTTLFLPPISAAVAWVAGRRRRTRDNLEALQEIMKLRRENAQLRTSISALEAKLDSLTKKNALANGKL